MGSNKKHKVKKHKTHSREIKDETESAAGKMKVIFRVPPPHPSSPRPDDPSLLVSLPLEEIARARQYLSEEGDQGEELEVCHSSKTHHRKKHKKKHHHHHKTEIVSPPSSFYGNVSERDVDDDRKEEEDNNDEFGKGVWSQRRHGGGKDFSFHKMPGKEMRVQAGPYLDDEEEDECEDMDVNVKEESRIEERETMSLPVEIDLDMLSLRSKKPHTSGKEWKSLKTPKTSLSSSIGVSGTTSSSMFLSPPTKSPSLALSPFKSSPLDISDSFNQPTEAEKKKKRKKKKHKHHHTEESPAKKTKKLDGKTENKWVEPVEPPGSVAASDFSPAVSSVPARQEEKEEDLSLSSDVVMQDSQESSSQGHALRHTHSPESTTMSVPSPTSSSSSRIHGIKLPRSAFRYFLKHLHHQIQRSDPDGVFAEPVTDDIAPGYSTIIKQSMDLQMVALKIDNNGYSSVDEFKDDFALMCNNAMTYNAPDTQYYQFAKRLLNFGLKLIQKEMSLRPDIRHGLIPSSTASPQPPSNPSSVPPPSSQTHVDYTSPFLCKLDLATLRPPTAAVSSASSTSGLNLVEDNSVIDVSGELVEEQVDQSHLTQVHLGFEEDVPEVSMFQSDEETEEEILRNVDKAYIELKNNNKGDSNTTPPPDLSFLSHDDSGKTVLHILNPDSVTPQPVNLTSLAEKVKAGENASTVLNTELPVFKATPVSYLMYGPFGSFAPTYDTSFANLTKHDSSLLLSTYGNELGVTYTNSLQQFVKGCGSFATEMADAILNSLTNGRHMKFVDIMKKEEEERKKKEEKEGENGSNGDSGKVHEEEEEEDGIDELSKADDEAREAHQDKEGSEERGVVEVLEEESDQGDKGAELEGEGMEVTDEMENQKILEHRSALSPAIQDSLSHTSCLLMELESAQQDRLVQPAQLTSEGSYVLPGPSGKEMETATQVSSELVTLTSKVTPSDVSSIPSLHQAMGIVVDKNPKQTT